MRKVAVPIEAKIPLPQDEKNEDTTDDSIAESRKEEEETSILNPIRIGIIGMSGRNVEQSLLTKSLFEQMYRVMVDFIEQRWSWNRVRLVSGGAAWSDHLAVALFLSKNPLGLTLYLPCEWIKDDHRPQFQDKGIRSPGHIANHLHREFSKVLKRDSLSELEQARVLGAEFNTQYKGFLARNKGITSSVDVLVAFSWAKGSAPTHGGTLDTWRKCTSKEKIHFALHTLLHHQPSSTLRLSTSSLEKNVEQKIQK
jgi:hypothetical protein